MLNDDNDESRRVVEHCYRTYKTLVNPIIDWEDEDVWEFLNRNNIPHCSLYDQGFVRIGCINCQMARKERRVAELERWPKYKDMYSRALQKMLQRREESGLENKKWGSLEEVWQWWLE